MQILRSVQHKLNLSKILQIYYNYNAVAQQYKMNDEAFTSSKIQ